MRLSRLGRRCRSGSPRRSSALGFSGSRTTLRSMPFAGASSVEFVPMEDCLDAPSSEPNPAHQAEVTQEVRQLDASLKKLAPEHRQVLLLREVEGMSYEEIAGVLSLNEGTVKSRLARARTALIEIRARSRS